VGGVAGGGLGGGVSGGGWVVCVGVVRSGGVWGVSGGGVGERVGVRNKNPRMVPPPGQGSRLRKLFSAHLRSFSETLKAVYMEGLPLLPFL